MSSTPHTATPTTLADLAQISRDLRPAETAALEVLTAASRQGVEIAGADLMGLARQFDLLLSRHGAPSLEAAAVLIDAADDIAAEHVGTTLAVVAERLAVVANR